MKFWLLEITPESLQLPKVTESDLMLSLVTVCGFLILAAAYIVYYRFKVKKNAAWILLKNYAITHDLSAKEISVLETFFNSLSLTDRQNILFERKRFAELLQQFLKNISAKSTTLVKFFDKLILSSQTETTIHGLVDLNEGELVAVDLEEESTLANILNVRGSNARIVLHNRNIPFSENLPAKLFAYRPGLGGYLFSGVLQDKHKDTVIFCQSGSIEFKGEQHLMAYIEMPVLLQPDIAGLHIDENYVAPEFKMQTITVSDRAMLVNPIDHIFTQEREKFEHWHMRLNLPDTTLIECRVKIHNSKSGNNTLILKFLDIQEKDRHKLFELISRSKPVREQIL
ncbi:MAG: hypothetical protein KDK38_10295 [Leptospiraceae bacterium]|nr:hypothetical protein [Leptospiraceae bacterium]